MTAIRCQHWTAEGTPCSRPAACIRNGISCCIQHSRINTQPPKLPRKDFYNPADYVIVHKDHYRELVEGYQHRRASALTVGLSADDLHELKGRRS